jgi:hypothetical protein
LRAFIKFAVAVGVQENLSHAGDGFLVVEESAAVGIVPQNTRDRAGLRDGVVVSSDPAAANRAKNTTRQLVSGRPGF